MNPILESVRLAVPRVSPVLLLPFFARTFRDHSGYGNHATPNGGSWKRQHGVASYYNTGFSDNLVVADSPELQRTEVTAFWWGEHVLQNQGRIISKRDAGGTNYDIYTDDVPSNRVAVNDGVSGRYLNVDIIGAKSGAVTIKDGEIPKVYLDGAFIGAMNGAVAISVDDAPVYIASMFAAGQQWRNPMAGVGLWPGTLTAAEIAALHPWSQEQISPIIQADRRYFDLGSVVPVGGGEVAAWDFGETVNREVIDKSGGSNTGTVVGGAVPSPMEIGRAMRFDGLTGIVDCGNDASLRPTDALTVVCWMRNRAAGNLELVNYRKSAADAYYSLYAIRDDSVQVNVDDGNTNGHDVALVHPVPLDVWSQVGFVFSRADQTLIGYLNGVGTAPTATGGDYPLFVTAPGLSKLYVGAAQIGIRYALMDVKDLRIFGEAKSAEWMAENYRERAGKAIYEQDFSMVPPTIVNVTAGQMIPGTDYTIGSGTWKVDEDAATGERYIEGVSAGVIWRNNFEAYGTWEFNDNLLAANTQFYSLLATGRTWGGAGNNGYVLYRHSDNTIRIAKMVNGGVSSWVVIGPTIADNIRYSTRATHTVAGLFTIYIKGGIYSGWTEIGSGTDVTYTASLYSMLYLRAADRLYLDRQWLGEVAP